MAVEAEVAEFVNTEQVEPAVAGDGFRELVLAGGFGEFVDQFRGQRVADPVALFGGGGAEPDEQVGFPGAGVPDQA